MSFFLRGPDSSYTEAWDAAALVLAAHGPTDAGLVVATFSDGSIEFRQQLRDVLQQQNLDELAAKVQVDFGAGALGRFDQKAHATLTRALLAHLVSLGNPVALSPRQSRRLEEISDLYETACLNWIYPTSSDKRRDGLSPWVRCCALLGGFDGGVVASQAAQVLAEIDEGDAESHWLLSDIAQARRLDHWERVERPADLVSVLAECVFSIPVQASRRWLFALLTAEDQPLVAATLERLRPRLRVWARELVALGVAEASADPDRAAEELLTSDNPLDRAGAAGSVSVRSRERRPLPSAAHACAVDPDANVRRGLLSHWGGEDVDDEMRVLLEQMRQQPVAGWRCTRCGEDNPPPSGASLGCHECGTSPPQVGEAVRDLLGLNASGRVPRVRPRPRRVRSADDLDVLGW